MKKTLGISARLWIPTLVVTGVFATIGVGTFVRTQSALATNNQQQASQQQKLEIAYTWSGLTESNAVRAVASVSASDGSVEAALKPEVAATTEKISGLRKQLEALGTDDEEKAVLANIDSTRKAYIDARSKAIKAKADGDAAGSRAALDSQVKPALATYLAAQQAYVKLQQGRADALRARIGDESMRTVWTVLAILALIVVGLGASTAAMVRSIRRPMEELVNAAERIGHGDLTVSVDTQRGDEIGAVMRALAEMRDSLRKIVSEVRSASDSIHTASSEVAAGNQDLSQRTEHTASNLQQTASSVEQLASNVRQNADAAAQANQMASSASDAARRGGEVVTQVVTNMQDISASSRRIADIIGTIDGIAFQTNILALNAAVEAARAGEQGRGFAVVAGEVRSLAQRSAEAAREIKSLIGASVEKVESGSKLVQDAGATMSEIVQSVQRVTDIIGEISAATHEQNQGIGQVNTAVNQLDQMTQQNAALVEESAAAAASLSDQAQTLNRVIQVFRIDGDGGASSYAASSVPPVAPAPMPAARPLASSPATRAKASLPALTTTAAAATAASAGAFEAPASLPTLTSEVRVSSPAAVGNDDDWETF